MDPTKRCPLCGEHILRIAVRCKHCHADLRSLEAAPDSTVGATVEDDSAAIPTPSNVPDTAPQVIAPVPPPPPIVTAPPSSSGQSGGITNNNTNTVDPVITANPTNTATNNANNDNRSSATVTNNNTIYVYPPSYTPPVPGSPVVAQPSILPPPLVPDQRAVVIHRRRVELQRLVIRPHRPRRPRRRQHDVHPRLHRRPHGRVRGRRDALPRA